MEENLKIRPAIEGLKVNETISFPIDRLRVVRVTASDLGLMLDRRYTTITDRDDRTVTVKRIA